MAGSEPMADPRNRTSAASGRRRNRGSIRGACSVRNGGEVDGGPRPERAGLARALLQTCAQSSAGPGLGRRARSLDRECAILGRITVPVRRMSEDLERLYETTYTAVVRFLYRKIWDAERA